jgi:Uma2 family endonuclease
LPGRNAPLPRIDDRLAPPETRLEYLDGIEVFASPANPLHATHHWDLTYVLGAHVAKGYRGAVDMLTRTSETSDFAPDASIFAQGRDRKTGGRKLEELAFEVTDQQALSVPTDKARKLVARGVRRVFCVLVKQQRVMEWSRETDGWQPLQNKAVIDDACLVRPLPIAALLDAAGTDDAVARALLDKHVPALEHALAMSAAEGEARGKLEGKLEAKREMLVAILRKRGLSVSSSVAGRIAACATMTTLDRWLDRAITATTAAAVIKDGAPRPRPPRAISARR